LLSCACLSLVRLQRLPRRAAILVIGRRFDFHLLLVHQINRRFEGDALAAVQAVAQFDRRAEVAGNRYVPMDGLMPGGSTARMLLVAETTWEMARSMLTSGWN